jgi:hypothetical protein
MGHIAIIGGSMLKMRPIETGYSGNSKKVDQIICATTPQPFFAVGMFYCDFAQTMDEEVRILFTQARNRQSLPQLATMCGPRCAMAILVQQP